MKSYIIILCVFALLFSACNKAQDKNVDNNEYSLTREEIVKKIPYRNQKIENSEIDAIKKDVKSICSLFKNEILDSEDVLLGIKKIKNGKFILYNDKWGSINELKDYLNKAWRNKDFIATIAVFNSYTKNVQTADIKDILVVELEYEMYTGKWTAFFDCPLKKNFYDDEFELTYYERN